MPTLIFIHQTGMSQLTSFHDFPHLQLGFNDYLDLLSFDVRGAEGACDSSIQVVSIKVLQNEGF